MLRRVDKQTWDEANRLIGQIPHRNQIEGGANPLMSSVYLTYVGEDKLAALIIPGDSYPEDSLLLADLPAIEAEYEKRYSGN